MKKLKSLLTLGLMLCAASQAMARVEVIPIVTSTNEWDSQRITRSDVWEITGSSEQTCRAWADGCFNDMMDGNTGTWWHSFYYESGKADNPANANTGGCHITDGSCPYHDDGQTRASDKHDTTSNYPHFFLVNLDKNDANYKPWINKVKYTSRTDKNDQNGKCNTYSVYILDRDDVPVFPSLNLTNSNRKDLYDYLTANGITPDKQGSAVNGANEIELLQPKQGHWVLFVFNTAVGGYAHCAEFDVQTCEVEMQSAPIYTTGQEGYTSTSDRRTYGLGISDTDGNSQTVESLQSTSGATPVFFDKTATVFSTTAGAQVTILPDAHKDAHWMHRYVYIDRDNDGFDYDDASTYVNDDYTIKDKSDLLCYSFFNKATNHNNLGYSASGYGTTPSKDVNANQWLNEEIAFTIPADLEPGTYRARYKVDWNHLDPAGWIKGNNSTENSLAKNGGIIVDFTIEILAPPSPQPFKQEAYNAFETQMNNFSKSGFASEWEEGSIEEILADLYPHVNDDMTLADFEAAVAEAREDFFQNATPKGLVQLMTQAKDGQGYAYAMYYNMSENNSGKISYLAYEPKEYAGSERFTPNTLWIVKYAGNGKFKLMSNHSLTHVVQPANGSEEIDANGTLEEAAELEFCHFHEDGYFAISHGHADTPYIFYPYNSTLGNSVAFENLTNSTGSYNGYAHWKLVPFVGEQISAEETVAEVDGTVLNVTFKNGNGHTMKLHDAAYYPSHMYVTVTRKADSTMSAAPMRRVDGVDVEEDENEGTTVYTNADFVKVNEGASNEYAMLKVQDVTVPGNYVINVPAGFLRATWNMAGATSLSVNIPASGAPTVTGIEEVGAEAAPATVEYFDMQGRRVAQPTHGLYIRRAGNTASKVIL